MENKGVVSGQAHRILLARPSSDPWMIALNLSGCDTSEHANAEVTDAQRLRVFHPIHNIRPAAIHLDGKGAI